MAYEFKKLSEVEALNEMPTNANTLIEVDGSIKRAPGNGLLKTIVITQEGYDEALAAKDTNLFTNNFICSDMTFEEAMEAFTNGEFLNIIVKRMLTEGKEIGLSQIYQIGYEYYEDQTWLNLEGEHTQLYWTVNGITASYPGPVN